MPTLAVSSPTDAAAPTAVSSLKKGLDLIAAERDGLAYLHDTYTNDKIAQTGFESAVATITNTTFSGGKLVVSGVGKSGLIGKKMIATFNSLGIRCGWLHPTEALHGDLGMIGPNDTLLLITFSGKTGELMEMMPHLPENLPIVLMSSATPASPEQISTLPLFAARHASHPSLNILLSTPIPVPEATLFGISAPTVSTTVTLSLGDALAMAAACRLHDDGIMPGGVRDVFRRYHPGGAIGKAAKTELKVEVMTVETKEHGNHSGALAQVQVESKATVIGPYPAPATGVPSDDGDETDVGSTASRGSSTDISERGERLLALEKLDVLLIQEEEYGAAG